MIFFSEQKVEGKKSKGKNFENDRSKVNMEAIPREKRIKENKGINTKNKMNLKIQLREKEKMMGSVYDCQNVQ